MKLQWNRYLNIVDEICFQTIEHLARYLRYDIQEMINLF